LQILKSQPEISEGEGYGESVDVVLIGVAGGEKPEGVAGGEKRKGVAGGEKRENPSFCT
jgi:hypothetical protein